MEIQTKYHGEIHVEENKVIKFEQGIPGFFEEKEFVLLPLDQESPFLILQSKLTAELGFVVVNPFVFFEDYEFELSEPDKDTLKLENEKDIQVFAILTLKEPFDRTTANLQAPVIINKNINQAKQIILNDKRYTTKHRLFIESKIK